MKVFVGPEFWEYLGEGLVFIGVVLEVICERKLILKEHDERRDRLERRGGWILVVGLAISLAALAATNEHFGGTIAELRSQAAESNKEAAEANERASKADLRRAELENRIVDIFGQRQLSATRSARIVTRLAGLRGVKIDVDVLADATPYSPSDLRDSEAVGLSVVHTLRSARLDVAGWLLASCANGVQVSNLVVIATGRNELKAASQVLGAFRPEIAVYPEVQDDPPACTKFSNLDPTAPNKREHDAAIRIAQCSRRDECGGLFQWAVKKHSSHIHPL
jgi:hypothetical protein